MKPRRRPVAFGLPVSALMALVVLVVSVVMVFGAFQQQSVNEQKNAEVIGRDKLLDQREASLDQRRSELDRRDDAIESQEQAQSDAQKALDQRQAKLDEEDAALKSREQALEEGVQALADGRAALQEAENDLASREQVLRNAQAEAEAKLNDYAELQNAVNDVLGARSRIAARLREAFKAAGLTAAVDGDGGATIEMSALFSGSSATFTKAGQQALDAFLPVWYGALSGESLAALSVEALAPLDGPEARDLAARRAAAIVKYASGAPALPDAGRAAFLNMGLAGARLSADGESLAVFRFYLSNDALRQERAG